MPKIRLVEIICGAVLLAVIGLTAGQVAAQDLKKGAKVFRKCKACHRIGENAQNNTGPQLNEVYGRTVGGAEAFTYSKAMLLNKENGLIWTDEALNAFLTNPKKYMPGTKMTYAGLGKESDRVNVIAYLATFSTPVDDPKEKANEIDDLTDITVVEPALPEPEITED